MKFKILTKVFFFSTVLLLFSCSSASVEDVQISFNEADLPMQVGNKLDVVAVVKAPDGLLVEVRWESSNNSVAVVQAYVDDSKRAFVEAKSVGSCLVTAKVGNRSKSFELKVVETRSRRGKR